MSLSAFKSCFLEAFKPFCLFHCNSAWKHVSCSESLSCSMLSMSVSSTSSFLASCFHHLPVSELIYCNNGIVMPEKNIWYLKSVLNINVYHSLGNISRRKAENMFLILRFKKTDFDISCKLSRMETVCIKCRSLFSGKNQNKISKFSLQKLLPSMISIN